jgi:Mn2+/Fe2+ NRAMP family transporter
MKFGEAPAFYWLYTFLIVAGAVLEMLIPEARLIRIALLSQVLNGVVLPFVLVFMILLINKKDLMGEYVNTPLFNVVAWLTTGIMIILSLGYFWTIWAGGGG